MPTCCLGLESANDCVFDDGGADLLVDRLSRWLVANHLFSGFFDTARWHVFCKSGFRSATNAAQRVSRLQYERLMSLLLRTCGFLFLLITLLPLIPTGKWYVRWWDFPRLQIAMLLAIPLTIAFGQLLKNGFQWEQFVWTIALSIGIAWQVSHTIPFSPLWSPEVETSSESFTKLKLMVANLDYENANPTGMIDELAEEHADVLLLIEFNEDWKSRLVGLEEKYPYRHEEVRGEGLGIAVWSKLPIESAQTRHLVSERRASIWAKVRASSGEVFNLVGVHPTPPGLLDSTGDTRRDSRVRDAELILIAKEIADRNDEAWIVAGDFNDVAWSHTTRLFKRTSGLLDPRIGRGLYSTYMAQYPPFRCPIDHVFVSECFSVSMLDRKRLTGSDHFAVLTSLSFKRPKGVTPEPQGNDEADAENLIEQGKEDAAKRDVDA